MNITKIIAMFMTFFMYGVINISAAEINKIQNPIVSKDGLTFIYHNNYANSVYLKSSFDKWKLRYPFTKDVNGLGVWNGYWVLTLPVKYSKFQLQKGRYTYKLLVNGEFVEDKLNDNILEDSFGYYVSYFDIKDDLVSYEEISNPSKLIGLKNTYRFIFRSYGAKSVYLVGDFNNWNSYSFPMVKKGDGIFEIVIKLTKGTYYYNIIVDDNWIVDPLNLNSMKSKLNKAYSYLEVKN